MPTPDHPGFVEGAPDLAIEIASPSNSAAEIDAKVRDYLRSGSRLVWVVYPETRIVAVHEPAAPVRSLGADQELNGADVVPGLRIALPAVFRT